VTVRSGVTLIEMIVVLTILAVLASVVAPAHVPRSTRIPTMAQTLAESLRVAIASCRAVRAIGVIAGRAVYATAQCDGSIVADKELENEKSASHRLREQ
jgi:prepilin-type N-terminal cleavage/methylation domain-containing protein